MSNRDYASTQLAKVLTRIQNACTKAGRDPSTVRLVGASKHQSARLIRDFAEAGLHDVGENYLQEAQEKQSKLSDTTLKWHYIGQIQSNKCKAIAEHFSWVHGVDRLKVARRLNQHMSAERAPLKVLVQINIDDEQSKAGVSAQAAPDLCAQISELERLTLTGLMMIPAPQSSPERQRATFAQARELLSQINQHHGLSLSELSMGMSNDLEQAILEGSTQVRIGTDLFGART
ncbi:UPF0001 protein [Arenicella chitinivorans]|uniref:Pyridoxal phosphate homeostasis protein n=1 Tax=Arenicella chitinivorans TaxID=1329800 RepID=A0A918RLS9_9GAMM|nr:YggS family pyridoxal phosphate-dependent enzyme [Arenicella chitinivorans]GHA05170.1 UPF0001 protein [Arenicella chitinivorans]